MKRKIRALSISGGGIKGLIPAYILMEMEKKLQELTGRPDERIAHYFDLFSGTSVGGILTALYLAPVDSSGHLRSAKEVYQTIIEAMKFVFHESSSTGQALPDPEYSSSKAREILNDYFKNQQLKDLAKPTLITAYEPNRNWMSFFRQQHAAVDPAANFLLTDVCLSTGAMPLYFNPVVVKSFSEKKVTEHSFIGAINASHSELSELLTTLREAKFIDSEGNIIMDLEHAQWDQLPLPDKWLFRKKIIYSLLERAKNPNFTFVDGAIFANNPSLCTVTEAANTPFPLLNNHHPKLDEMILVSLGTGIKGKSEPYSSAINSRFSTQLMSMLFACSETLAHYQCFHAFSSANVADQYFYLDPVINELLPKTVPSYHFGDTRPDNIQALEEIVAAYVDNHRYVIDTIVLELMKEQTA